MNTLNTLSTLISEKVRANELPDITLTDSNSLQTIVRCLVAGQNTPTEIERTPKAVHEAMVEFNEATKDEEQYGELLNQFTRLGDAFAARIGGAYKDLTNIKDIVKQLVSQTAVTARNRIAEDPVLASTEADNMSTVRLKPVRWDLLEDVSEPVLVHKLCNKLGIEEIPTGSEKYIQSVLIARLPYQDQNNKPELPEVVVAKSKAKDMINAVSAKVGKKLSKEAVQMAIAHIMSLDEYKCRKAVGSISRFALGETADEINDMLRMVYVYNTVMPHLNRDTLGVAASTQAAIDKRVAVMESYIDVTAYLCSTYRNEIWKDAIVVPGMKVNTDNWRDFVSKESQAIKTNPHLAILQYKSKVYGDTNLPLYGIKGDVIAKSCDQIAKEAYAEASANTLACNQRKKEIFRDAFIVTAGQWLRKQPKYSLEFMYSQKPEQFAASVYDSNRDDAVENMYYTVIMNSCRVNTLTAKLHNRLRDEYKKLALTANSINERDIINADTKVLADTINEFMVDLLLK